MANALLTYPIALGYVTELLSGDFATPFGRSSHHQVWSEAMVVTPVIRGLLGVEASDGGRTLRFAPALPATWDRVGVTGVTIGSARLDLTVERSQSPQQNARLTIRVMTRAGSLPRLAVSPAFPLDARVRSVTINGSAATFDRVLVGDVQRIEVRIDAPAARTDVVFAYEEGTDVYSDPKMIEVGQQNEGLRIIRARAEGSALRLTVEGRSGRAYPLTVRTLRRLGSADGVVLLDAAGAFQRIEIRFAGTADDYVRREITIPLS
jgi:hypothetical protein